MTELSTRQVYTASTPFDVNETDAAERETHLTVHSAGSEIAAHHSQVPTLERRNSDPELVWLSSPEARHYEGHWVALDPDSGEFLGLADSRADLRRWREQDVSVLYVEPRTRRIG